MPSISVTKPSVPSTSTSTPIHQKLLNIFVSPGEVFEEVIMAPPRMVNWVAPTLLICVAGLILLRVATSNEPTATAISPPVEVGAVSAAQAEKLSGDSQMISWLTVCLVAILGTLWSSFVLWFVGRAFLKTRFSFLKTVEVVGLTGIILVLGSIVTALLIAACGNSAARPALSLLASELDTTNPIRAVLDVLNLFHLWTTTVLAVGLSKLSGVSFKESAFWVFGYWLLARIALIILA
ncbi:MAG: YIP1 family protein [Verrucomicrobiota bacterium]